MRVVYRSDYLERREAALFEQARNALAEPLVRPSGWFRRLLWEFSKDAARQRGEREAKWRQLRNEARNYVVGRRGEDVLMDALDGYLDGRYLLVRNYEPPRSSGAGGDVDAVLVGPHGVTVFEVKTWKGLYRVSGGQWQFYSRQGGWKAAFANPSAQVRWNAERLDRLLAAQGLLGVPIQAVVALASKDAHAELPPLSTHVFYPCRRPIGLDWLPAPQLTKSEVGEIETALLRPREMAQEGPSNERVRDYSHPHAGA